MQKVFSLKGILVDKIYHRFQIYKKDYLRTCIGVTKQNCVGVC